MSRIRLVSVSLVLIALASAAFVLSGATPATPAKPATRAKSTAPAKAGTLSASGKANQIERGHKLAIVSGCVDCHTPGTLFGAPDFDRQLSGSELGWQGPWGTTYARNLTPDLETGVGYYKEQEIVNALKSGRRLDGTPLLPPMPWQNLSAYDDAELHAIVAYMLNLKPISHQVPDRLPPGQTPKGSFLVFPPPAAWDVPIAPAGADSMKR